MMFSTRFEHGKYEFRDSEVPYEGSCEKVGLMVIFRGVRTVCPCRSVEIERYAFLTGLKGVLKSFPTVGAKIQKLWPIGISHCILIAEYFRNVF